MLSQVAQLLNLTHHALDLQFQILKSCTHNDFGWYNRLLLVITYINALL